MGFLLSSGDIVITWESGKRDDSGSYSKGGIGPVFDKIRSTLPEMILS
ncbi:MAG: hypothetical protein U0X39_16340 [Bacteroidales bacterium]